MIMNYVFTLDSVFKSVLPKTQNRLEKSVCLTYSNVLLSFVNETVFAWKPAFVQDSVNHFMAQENTLCQGYLKMHVVGEGPQVILLPKKIKSVTISPFTQSIYHEVVR